MYGILLTSYQGAILGPIAKIEGLLMNGIFILLDKIGIPNIGLAIILFTIVIYMLLLPLTIKQQRFSKLSIKMQPEVQAIQNKYKNKKDTKLEVGMLAKIFLILLIPSILTFLEPDTGVVIIYFIITLSMLFIKGINKKIVITIIIIMTMLFGSIILLYLFKKEIFRELLGSNLFYRIERILNCITEK